MQFRTWLLAIFLLFAIPLHADGAKDLQRNLQNRFFKKVFLIRNFYGGNHLTFDSQGALVKGEKTVGYHGCWCAAQLQIEKVEVKKDELILQGPRIVGIYDSKKREFSKLFREGSSVQLEIELDSSQIDEQTIVGILEKVFFAKTDDLERLIPDAWRAPGFDPEAHEVTRVKKDAASEKENVSAPKPVHTPDPEYSEQARRAGIAGDVLLWLVVDEQGKVVRIRVMRCLGAGLDERAVQTVSTWRFEPAQRDGQPVAVQLNVDVTFHLYR
ncbi:MAG TPA: energy transducer TonB [Candidatus Angelobacter sp.]|nr:energy transducer TonB [Candidatus Angelobacter sp.]